MKMYQLSLLLGALVLVGMISCQRETPAGKAGNQSNPAADSPGQAIVDSVKTPLDKAHQVEQTLEKGAGRTADTVKDAPP